MILQATVNGNVGAAMFLHQCTEAAKVLINQQSEVQFNVFEKDFDDVMRKLLNDDSMLDADRDKEESKRLLHLDIPPDRKPS
jgi:hypothetical protein